MSERCYICGARVADHQCYQCSNTTCSACMDVNDLMCRNCMFEKTDEVEGVRISYAPLKKMVNVPLFVGGITAVIIGLVVIMSASFTASQPLQSQVQQPEGFIYIFPFPFVFTWGSHNIVNVLPLIIAMEALPIVIIFLMFRKFYGL